MSAGRDIQALIRKVEVTHALAKDDVVALLRDTHYVEDFFAAADRVRRKYVGDDVHLRGLIEFSNICKQNCLYCGLRRDNHKLKRYRLKPETIVEFAEKAQSYGYRTVVLQSGEDEWFDVETMTYLIKKIKEMDLAVTLSVGEKPREVYQKYREAGADRYLLRIETTDKDLYEKLDPGMSWDNRVRCLIDLKELGFELGTGCLVGIPGQTVESLADDILFFKKLDADMIGVGPFIPNPDTPLAAEKGGTFEQSTKVMAMTRLLLPDSNIPATTAMESLNPQGRVLALQRGANVVMPNVTEGEYRQLYQLYPGKICINDTPAHCRFCITGKILGIGRRISETQGFRVKQA
ncbi:[FeFe] hydrogenase H-cluster radical SAM maturase HydE [Sporomusa acidovorans]|uniref:[FeFe] hydrogenase maturase subunit HydE n=1 Tax=Sporomusa acidovorans (strain ATCC 49682 / DSM 3132 / Mol) TaxID=1123286 RepID=A0ABZ3IYN3_SPOA4|nr:[FeFe] hydrogenase H-cluster radical SAM maturase HydE [Sporomusa acidovorans]OZC17277.1 biotin synthase [Sporomusa acidovorans DSM 3132]SDF16382.1 biotin synthase [Sporomusa acidovorans]